MTKKKKPEVFERDTVVVGTGPSGLLEASTLEGDFVVLEAEDRSGGRMCRSPLHLGTVEESVAFQKSQMYEAALIKWNGDWSDASTFEFDPKLWHFSTPQWQLYVGRRMSLLDHAEISEELKEKTSFSSPVSKIEKQEGRWRLEVQEDVYWAKNVIWSAGLKPFQNAYGKVSARAFSKPNPKYNPNCDDTSGGIAVNWYFSEKVSVKANIPKDHILFVPVKHNKLYYLSIVVVVEAEGTLSLRTLNYLPVDLLSIPKELLSFQKSLRRVLKSLMEEGLPSNPKELIIQSPSFLGHQMGMAWLLGSEDPSLCFVGDETLAAVESSFYGLESVLAVHGMKTKDSKLTDATRLNEVSLSP